MIADWLTASGLAILKPLLSACVLPPTPFIVLALLGGWWMRRRRGAGFALLALSCVAIWLSGCEAVGWWLQRTLLDPPPPLSAPERSALADRAAHGEGVAIVVLGGGVDRDAPEYGGDDSNLAWPSLERLHYGVWLGQQTRVPVGFTGGAGWAAGGGPPLAEATLAARLAARDFGHPLRWQETASRDTHENAVQTLALLRPQGIRRIVLVTHNWHMPRALREFRAAAASGGPGVEIEAASIGPTRTSGLPALSWVPSEAGVFHVRLALHEAIGLRFAH